MSYIQGQALEAPRDLKLGKQYDRESRRKEDNRKDYSHTSASYVFYFCFIIHRLHCV